MGFKGIANDELAEVFFKNALDSGKGELASLRCELSERKEEINASAKLGFGCRHYLHFSYILHSFEYFVSSNMNLQAHIVTPYTTWA